MPRPPSRVLRRGRTAALGVLLAVSAVACSISDVAVPDADKHPSAASPAPATSTAADPADPVADVVTTATLGTVTGALSPQRRTALVKRMRLVVDEWIDAAYADGPYPGGDFTDAFEIFTVGAAQRARRDAALMSNTGLGAEVDGVEMLDRSLTIDVLAVEGAPAGVTAHVSLGMEILGDTDRREQVTGSLFLTYEGTSWHVFGYEMDRGEV